MPKAPKPSAPAAIVKRKPAFAANNIDAIKKSLATNFAELKSVMRRSIVLGFKVGEMLIQAKAIVGHGNWSAWLAGNFPKSARMARCLVQLFEGKDLLPKNAIHEMGLADAVKYIAKARAEMRARQLAESRQTPLAPDLGNSVVEDTQHDPNGGDPSPHIDKADEVIDIGSLADAAAEAPVEPPVVEESPVERPAVEEFVLACEATIHSIDPMIAALEQGECEMKTLELISGLVKEFKGALDGCLSRILRVPHTHPDDVDSRTCTICQTARGQSLRRQLLPNGGGNGCVAMTKTATIANLTPQ